MGCSGMDVLKVVSALALACAGPPFGDALSNEIGRQFSLSESYRPGDSYMGVRLLGTLELKTPTVDGLRPRELSGLAWDADERVLYAVSDDGFIVHLRPSFSGDLLTGVELVSAHLLLDEHGQPLPDHMTDAEDLALRASSNGVVGDTELVIPFEREPRISVFRPDGSFIGTITLPVPLQQREAFQGANQELEALTAHPQYGLITAPERPLKTAPSDRFTLYSIDGRQWTYTPLDRKYSTLVGLETMPGGDLLALERRYSSIFKPVIFAVRRVHLSAPGGNAHKPVSEIIHLDNSRGWAVDNFEAIARHEGSRYFLVSDDNESAFQKTLLLYFEILEDDGEREAAPP